MKNLPEFFDEKKAITLKKGQYLLKEGAEIDTICILLKGNVYIGRNSSDGRRIISNNLKAPQIFSLIELLNGEKEVLGNVIALNEVQILKIKTEEFLVRLEEPEIKNAAFEYLAKFCLNIIKTDIEYEKYDVEKAIFRYILNSNNDDSVKEQISKSFLADMFRVSERTLYRYLNAWENDGLIKRERGIISINEENMKLIEDFLNQ